MFVDLVQNSDLVVCVSRRKRRIPIQDILYFQSRGRQILLHLEQETLTFYGKLNELEPALPAGRFLRSHQSFLVNIDYVAEIGGRILLTDGTEIPVRTRQRPALYEAFYKMATVRSRTSGFRLPALSGMEHKWPRA